MFNMIFKKSYIVLILILVACGKDSVYKDMPIVGHAITGLYNPERIYKDNTLEAFEYALLFSELDGIEVDVQMSKDGTIWLYHDTDLSTQTKFSGAISSKTDEELQNISYNSFNKEKLTRLDQIIFPPNRLDMIFYVDLKDFSYQKMDTILAQQVVQSLQSFQNKNPDFTNLKIIIGDLAFANYFEENGFTEIYTDIIDFQDGINKKDDFSPLDGVFIKNQFISKEEVEKLKFNNLRVIIFELKSVFSIREAKLKSPNELLVIDFKKALKEK